MDKWKTKEGLRAIFTDVALLPYRVTKHHYQMGSAIGEMMANDGIDPEFNRYRGHFNAAVIQATCILPALITGGVAGSDMVGLATYYAITGLWARASRDRYEQPPSAIVGNACFPAMNEYIEQQNNNDAGPTIF